MAALRHAGEPGVHHSVGPAVAEGLEFVVRGPRLITSDLPGIHVVVHIQARGTDIRARMTRLVERRSRQRGRGRRARSSWRRSRPVGRPAPRSRRAMGGIDARGGGGGLWSTRHCSATAAATRRSMICVTSTTRSRSCTRASIRSPTRTVAAGLTLAPPTRTWPARQASAAAGRVGNSRTAHSHRSTRVESTAPSSRTGAAHGDAREVRARRFVPAHVGDGSQ